MSREARAHEQYLLQSQAQEESVRRAAVARAEQRTRRLESQRWFGISNSRRQRARIPITAITRRAGFPTIHSIHSTGWEAANLGGS